MIPPNFTGNYSVFPGNRKLFKAITLSTFFGIIDFGIIFANLFVIVSLSHGPRVRLPGTRRLLINLAIADLGLGILVMLPSIPHNLFNFTWSWNVDLCPLWMSLDVFYSTASIYGLATIAYDQYLAVTCALKYSQLMSGRRLTISIAVPWIIATMSSIPLFAFHHWSWILLPKHKRPAQCLLQNTGPIFLLYFVGVFSIPFISLWYCYIMVYLAIIRNIEGQSSGVIRDNQTLTQLKGVTSEKARKDVQNRCNNSGSTMRVHIGGQPCYMKFDGKHSQKTQSKIFTYLPGTLKCGFLIVSTTLPSKTSKENENQKVYRFVKNQACGIEERRNLSSITLREQNFAAIDIGPTAASLNGSREFSQQSFLKPPSRNCARSDSRKSDSEFANLRSMRRCALLPYHARMHHSVSDDMTGLRRNDFDTNRRTTQQNAVNCSPINHKDNISVRNMGANAKRKMKAIIQLALSCLTMTVGWLPYIFILTLGICLKERIHLNATEDTFFWGRFVLTCLNPFIVGSASEDLRKAFRVLIYCGHPKQEKKALQRLVLAGLSAAGIPYGRPIVTNLDASHTARKFNSADV